MSRMILVHHHEIITELTYVCKIAKAEIERLYAGQPEPNLQESHAYILLKQVTEELHNESHDSGPRGTQGA